jgi:hypothetical protein
MADRTVLDFEVSFDIGPVVDAWAKANRFGFRGTSPDGTRNFQRGHGLLIWAMLFRVRQEGSRVHLEAWAHATLYTRLGSLFLIPANMGIESGGIKGALPRGVARTAVNDLLGRLGQTPIR